MTSYPPQPGSSQQTPQPPLPSYPPPSQAYYPQPYPPPTRPGWATAIGVISIVLAGLAIVCTPISFITQALNPHSNEIMQHMYKSWYLTYMRIGSFFTVGLAVLNLVGGIMLLKRRPSARVMLLTYAFVAIAVAMLNCVLMTQGLSGAEMSESFRFGMRIGMIFALPIGLAYPIFLLAWFFRPKIASQMQTWQGA